MSAPFITPQFAPPRPAVLSPEEQAAEARKAEIMRELKKIAKRATRSADLTHAKRGSKAWRAEFQRVIEGGKPLPEPGAQGLTHRPVIKAGR